MASMISLDVQNAFQMKKGNLDKRFSPSTFTSTNSYCLKERIQNTVNAGNQWSQVFSSGTTTAPLVVLVFWIVHF